MGTELERRGVPINETAWSAIALLQHADVVQTVHEEYIQAGAEVHIINSFALARHVLDPVGMVKQFEALNRQSVALFDQAVESCHVSREELFLAGSLSTFAAYSDRSSLPDRDTLLRNYREQARILADAGVDLFALEMLFDVETTEIMLEAVREFELPIIVGFSCENSIIAGQKVISTYQVDAKSHSFEDVLSALLDGECGDDLILSIMHSDLDVTHEALPILRRLWKGPVAIYPNSGSFNNLKLQFDEVCSTDEFVAAAALWRNQGVEIIGGCCGIGPVHIEAANAIF